MWAPSAVMELVEGTSNSTFLPDHGRVYHLSYIH